MPSPAALYDQGVRYAYDATHAPSRELTKRYYDKAADLFEQAAKHGHAAAMMGMVKLCGLPEGTGTDAKISTVRRSRRTFQLGDH